VRRRAIVRCLPFDEELRASIDGVIIALGVNGMSEDETDTDALNGNAQPKSSPKILRRRKLRWVSNDISLLMDAVESYRAAVADSAFYDARGNKALERRFNPHSINEKSLPVKGLPRNWYDQTFYQSLYPHERKKLRQASKVDLPFLVSCFFFFFANLQNKIQQSF
jgi:hypothetical protein